MDCMTQHEPHAKVEHGCEQTARFMLELHVFGAVPSRAIIHH